MNWVTEYMYQWVLKAVYKAISPQILEQLAEKKYGRESDSVDQV